MKTEPFVSCLMVTRPRADRLALQIRSVAAYAAQSYQRKELVVVLAPRSEDVIDRGFEDHLLRLDRADIRVLRQTEASTLGLLRNLAVSAARGDCLCQWDDDDLHHPERLAGQVAVLRASDRGACYLQEVMQYLQASRALYWTNWLMTAGHVHPGTALWDKHLRLAYPESGPEASLGEDSAVLASLQAQDQVVPLAGQPHLYVYVTHGDNSWPPAHHLWLTETLSVTRGLLRRRETMVREGLAAFDFGPGPVTVTGTNGPAFVLNPSPAP